jgi:hypothetical protein
MRVTTDAVSATTDRTVLVTADPVLVATTDRLGLVTAGPVLVATRDALWDGSWFAAALGRRPGAERQHNRSAHHHPVVQQCGDVTVRHAMRQ